MSVVEHEGPVKVSGEGSVEGGVNHPSLLGRKIGELRKEKMKLPRIEPRHPKSVPSLLYELTIAPNKLKFTVVNI